MGFRLPVIKRYLLGEPSCKVSRNRSNSGGMFHQTASLDGLMFKVVCVQKSYVYNRDSGRSNKERENRLLRSEWILQKRSEREIKGGWKRNNDRQMNKFYCIYNASSIISENFVMINQCLKFWSQDGRKCSQVRWVKIVRRFKALFRILCAYFSDCFQTK